MIFDGYMKSHQENYELTKSQKIDPSKWVFFLYLLKVIFFIYVFINKDSSTKRINHDSFTTW